MLKERLEQSLKEPVRAPYNTGASVLRMVGVHYDIHQYGSDCFGKLQLLRQNSNDPPLQFLEADFRGFRHIGGIIDHYYVDPFLFLSEPIDIHEVFQKNVAIKNTEGKNMFVLAQRISNTQITVSLHQQDQTHTGRCFLKYHYDLSETKNSVDMTHTIDKLTPKWTVHVVYNRTHLRGVFDAVDQRWIIFSVNIPVEELSNNVEYLFEEALDVQHNNSLKQFERYFLEAHEAEKYVLYWQSKQT